MTMYPNTFMIEEALMMLLPALMSAIPSTLVSIASYVLSSMALYTLASRRGISKAWLSWVPVLNIWIIGSLSDQYRYVVKGQYRSKRKWLLSLKLVNLLLGMIVIGIAIYLVINVSGNFMNLFSQRGLPKAVTGSAFAILGLMLPMAGVGIAAAVIRYMALYDLYISMDPVNGVVFLVLSILFGITEPFFLFFNRNKDSGMPPRKTAVHEEPVCEPVEPYYAEV